MFRNRRINVQIYNYIYVPSLLCAEMVMCRVGYVPSLLLAELTLVFVQCMFCNRVSDSKYPD